MSESAPKFDIVFRGVRKDFNAAIAREKFASLFKLDAVKVARIFKSKNVTLKTGADERLAKIFISRLYAIGVIADKVSLEPIVSKAIYINDYGETSSDAYAMHQPVEFVYGEHIRRIPFVFSGTGLGYFKIWLVNVLVSLLSAGILHPWAQVRSLRYFYQHTHLDNIEFRCTFSPQKIFLVQFLLIAFMAALAYSFFYAPYYCLAGELIVLCGLPFYWFKRSVLIHKHSFYYNLNFNQHMTARDAYVIALAWPLLIIVSGGLLAPYAIFKMQKLWVQTKSLGGGAFKFTATPKKYFVLLPSLLMAEVTSVLCIHWRQHLPVWCIAAIILLVWMMMFLRWRVALVNLYWNGVSSRAGYFVSTWSLRSYTEMALKNIVFCSISFGAYWPWAKIRTAQYKATHLAFFANQTFQKWRRNSSLDV